MLELFTAAFWQQYGLLILRETGSTLLMTGVSAAVAYLLGLPLGVLLVAWDSRGIAPHRRLHAVVDWVVNIGRSIPFMILMCNITGFTRLLVGTYIGVRGALVPLVVSAAPFIARMVEGSLREVDAGVIEAAQSMGASPWQIVKKVYLPEALPSLLLGCSTSVVTILAYTTIAGAIGAGGMGDLALRYGYYRSVPPMELITVVLIVLLVQVIQSVFSHLSVKIDKRLR